MKKQKKCYIYTRVSTAIQVDGYSLDAQNHRFRVFGRRLLRQEYQGQTGIHEDDGEDRER